MSVHDFISHPANLSNHLPPECFSLGRRTRRVVADGANYPFGIAITDENVYWTDWSE